MPPGKMKIPRFDTDQLLLVLLMAVIAAGVALWRYLFI
jgi:hypothetical protein